MRTFKILRGTDSQVQNYIGEQGELVKNMTTGRVHLMDGTTSGGTELALLSDVGSTEGNVFEAFEGDLSAWSGDTSYFSISTAQVEGGSQSVTFDGSAFQARIYRTFSAGAYSKVYGYIYDADQSTATSNRPQIRWADTSTAAEGAIITAISHGDAGQVGEIVHYDGSSWVQTGIIVPEAEMCKIEAKNIDYGANTFDVEAFDSTGTTLGSSTGLPFRNAASQLSYVLLHGNATVAYWDTLGLVA